jgi:hypothetical protein
MTKEQPHGSTILCVGTGTTQTTADLLTAAKSVFDQVYAAAALNRKDLPAMVAALSNHDEKTLDAYRLRAGKRATENIADALLSLFAMSDSAYQRKNR